MGKAHGITQSTRQDLVSMASVENEEARKAKILMEQAREVLNIANKSGTQAEQDSAYKAFELARLHYEKESQEADEALQTEEALQARLDYNEANAAWQAAIINEQDEATIQALKEEKDAKLAVYTIELRQALAAEKVLAQMERLQEIERQELAKILHLQHHVHPMEEFGKGNVYDGFMGLIGWMGGTSYRKEQVNVPDVPAHMRIRGTDSVATPRSLAADFTGQTSVRRASGVSNKVIVAADSDVVVVGSAPRFVGKAECEGWYSTHQARALGDDMHKAHEENFWASADHKAKQHSEQLSRKKYNQTQTFGMMCCGSERNGAACSNVSATHEDYNNNNGLQTYHVRNSQYRDALEQAITNLRDAKVYGNENDIKYCEAMLQQANDAYLASQKEKGIAGSQMSKAVGEQKEVAEMAFWGAAAAKVY